MPTITRLQDLDKPKSSSRPQPDSPNEWASRCYNTLRWRKLREAKLQDSPLCEICLEKGKVTPATEVHHIHHVADVGSFLEAMDVAFDYNNLMSLCTQCHQDLHAREHKAQWKEKNSQKLC